MTLVGLFKGKGPSGFGYDSTAEEVSDELDLSGKTYVVTGCNSGLGAETMRVLTRRGARVIGTARSADKAEAARAAHGDDRSVGVVCELSEPSSVRAAVQSIAAATDAIDGIVCNAGVMALPTLEIKHGLELQFLANHVGHFILVTGLLDRLSDTGRVVMLSSTAHKQAPDVGVDFDNLDGSKGYNPWRAYGRSKLANLLFAKHLATRLPRPAQTANAVHPGVIATNLIRHIPKVAQVAWIAASGVLLKSVAQGAATQVYVAAHPDVRDKNGLYFADCNVASTSEAGRDAQLAARLWEETEALVAQLS